MTAVPEAAAALVREGLARAARGMSELLGAAADIAVERMVLAPAWQLDWLASEPEAEVVAIYVAFSGDLAGHCLLALDGPAAERLADRLVGGVPAPPGLRDSALLEFGNIAVSGVVNGIADRGGWHIRVAPPELARDMLGALVNTVLASASAGHRELLAVQGRLRAGDLELQGAVLLLPDADSLRELAAGRPARP